MRARLLRARSVALCLVAAGVLVTLSACNESEPLPDSMPDVRLSEIDQYVSMGDSFVSGPAIDPQEDGKNVCLRSTDNYPHLLAKELGISRLTDVSCAGASTYHLLHDVPVPGDVVTAQVAALSERTKLVTVGIGYNDDTFFTNLLAACIPSAKLKKGACQEFVSDQVPDLLDDERVEVIAALKEIRRQAPNAKVVFVGYLPLLPEPDTCTDDVFAADNQQSYYDVESDVDDNLRAAAKAAGTEFVSMRKAGLGHGMCAPDDEAWVNGAAAKPGDGVIVHPRAVGMEAVATELAEHLRAGDS